MRNEVQARPASQSLTEQIHVVMPRHLNGFGRLFGGQLAMWIDEVAGIAASRHCGMQVTTAAIDNLRFREAVSLNEVVHMRGRVTFVGTSSIETRVDSFAENFSGDRRLINTAFVINVALDENGRPTKVPGLLLETPIEEAEFAAGKKRRELRQKLNNELYD